MIKRLIAFMLALALVFSFAACGKDKTPDAASTTAAPVTSEPIPETEKKIAILLPAGSQFNEGSIAAKEIAAAYPDRVIIKEYDNSNVLLDNKNGIIDVSAEIAADSSVGAIVYAKASRSTSEAISAAKAVNPELLIACIEPEASVGTLASKSDFILCVDWVSAAKDIVANAKAQGAKYFVMTSFNRHISGTSGDGESLLASTAKSAFNTACKEQKIEFIYHNAPDPISSGGTKAVVKDIRDGLARYRASGKISGSDVAIFSTDCFIQNDIINIANENGYIYISPSFPSAFNGIADAYGVALPAGTADIAAYKASLAAAATGKARFGIYTYPLASTLIKSAVHILFDILAEKTNTDNLTERVTMRLTDAAANDKFTVKTFGGYGNVYAAYCPAFEVLK